MAPTRYEQTTNVVLTFVSAATLVISIALAGAAIALNADQTCDSITISPYDGGDCHWQLPPKAKPQPKKEKTK